MDSETETFCNSNKNHLQLQLEQPTRYADDIADLETTSNPDDDDKDKEKEGEEEDEAVDGEDTKTLQSTLAKIPLLYQVEPGCTPLSCYSAIATFIVMTLGIFWLLLISPPKNALPATIPPNSMVADFLFNDYQDNYDADYSTYVPETTTIITARESIESTAIDDVINEIPQSLVVADSES